MFEEMVGKSENQKVNLDHLQNNTASMICDADVLDGLKSGIKECPICHARCFADMDVCMCSRQKKTALQRQRLSLKFAKN